MTSGPGVSSGWHIDCLMYLPTKSFPGKKKPKRSTFNWISQMSTLTLSTIRQNLSKFDLNGLSIPVVVLVIMAMLVLPLPPLLL